MEADLAGQESERLSGLAHGRQTSPTLEGIRADHRHRYEWAAGRLAGQRVLDAGCGIGYGAHILGQAGCEVTAVDADEGAIEQARTYYAHDNVRFVNADIVDVQGEFDAIVCFEVLEHLHWAPFALFRFREMCPRLLCSVPNEAEYPFEKTRPLGHVRHYTPYDFRDLLCHWRIEEFGQAGKYDPVTPGFAGRTLVADCTRR